MDYYLRINRISKDCDTNLLLTRSAGSGFGFEGYIDSDVAQFVNGTDRDFARLRGAFNLFIHYENKSLAVANDKHGLLTLFYYVSDEQVLISNNFWLIAKEVFSGADSIDYMELRRFIFFIGCNPDCSTFVKGIRILPPASLFTYDCVADTVTVEQYWRYNRQCKISALPEAVDQAYGALDDHFKCIAKHFGDRDFIFGNSGGLDSRLIPYFGQKHRLRLSGFTVLNKRNNFGLKTATYLASQRVCRHYGFKQRYFPRAPRSFDERLLLDIRNAPITSCNMLDNPTEHLADVKDQMLIYGNPAYMIGHESWSSVAAHKNNTSWNYLVYYLLRMWSLNPMNLNMLSQCICVDDFLESADAYRSLYEQYKDTGYVNLLSQVHYRAMDLTAHSGGFESLNRTMFSLTLYYPFLNECSVAWNDKLFLNRAVLKELNRRICPALSKVPDQDFGYLSSRNSIQRAMSRVERRFALRASGMELASVAQSEMFLRFAKETMCRSNPLFEPLGSSEMIMEKVFASGIFPEPFTLNFLKVKKMLDILFWQQFELLESDQFSIV